LISNDLLLALGTFIGIITKMYALQAKSTVWSRKSSGLNLLFYPGTALLPFYREGLYVTFSSTLVTFLIWIGIYVFRAPESEDWLGRVDLSYSEWVGLNVKEYLFKY